VLKITGGKHIIWLIFEFSQNSAYLNHDRELVGLEFIHNLKIQKQWREFWPQTGSSQNWDAIGKIDFGDHSEWLLVEAKAHLGEVRSSCGARSPVSIEKIRAALQKTIQSFCAEATSIENWLAPYYQYANRLASLHFLMKECDPAVPGRLVFIYFYGDQRSDKERPQKEEDWHLFIKDIENRLGIDQSIELYRRVHHLFLPVNPYQTG